MFFPETVRQTSEWESVLNILKAVETTEYDADYNDTGTGITDIRERIVQQSDD